MLYSNTRQKNHAKTGNSVWKNGINFHPYRHTYICIYIYIYCISMGNETACVCFVVACSFTIMLSSAICRCNEALWLWKMCIQCYSDGDWIPLALEEWQLEDYWFVFVPLSLSSGNFHAVNWGIDSNPTMFVLSPVYHHRRNLEQEFAHVWHNTEECDQWLQHGVLFLKRYLQYMGD